MFACGKRFLWLTETAAPLAIVLAITFWAALVTIGFGFVFWGFYPDGFSQRLPIHESLVGRLWSVFYFSLVCLTTLGSTEVVPKEHWIDVVAGLESLIGISLVTASVTWIVLIYPALGRTRTLARRVYTLARAQRQSGVDLLTVDPSVMLSELGTSVLRARVDFVHFPMIYYFHVHAESTSIGQFLLDLSNLAERASANQNIDRVRIGAAVLKIALEDLAQVLRERFVPWAPSDPSSVFTAVADDHQNG